MKNRKDGFTLLELLIAFTIFSVAMVIVSSVFATGIAAWKRGEKESGFYQELRFALDRMAIELRNALSYEKIPFEGRKELVSFVQVHFPRSSPPEWVQVTYEIKKAEDSTFLVRRTTPFSGGETEEETLLSGLSEISFAYPFFEAEGKWSWEESWVSRSTSKKPPPFFQMELLKDEHEAWKKIFLIPTGEKGTSEEKGEGEKG